MKRNSLGPRGQHGAALLVMMLGVIIATATVLVVTVTVDALKARRQATSLDALGEARDA